MDTKNIDKLIQILKKSNLKSIEVEENGVRIKVESGDGRADEPQAVSYEKRAVVRDASMPKASAVQGHEVKSPLVGVFYSTPAPDQPPFVHVGKKVKKGDALCIIEAMKQLNEITADTDGEIIEVCAKSGDIVDYDQVLFRLA